MNAPVATERKSLLPLRLRSNTVVGSNSTSTTSRPTTPVTTPMPSTVQNDTKLSFTVGDRVLVNGLKIGTLRYIGIVKFAKGVFCGVELDEADGKHDGQVNDTRYFKCKINHGIFVPHDKVILAPRERASSTQRIGSRLKPPTMTRSMTISSSINNKTSTQLPDIIPNRSIPTPPISIPQIDNNPIIPDDHDLITPTEMPKIPVQSLPIDEPVETIEADFTDSVSLILHQLQQEQKSFLPKPRASIVISEEGTVDDDEDDDIDDDDDDDGVDNESISEPILTEKIPPIHRLPSITTDSTKSIQTDLSFDINDNITILKNNNLLDTKSLSYSNKSLASSTTSINKLPLNNLKRKPSIPTPVPVVKKALERKPSIPLVNTSTTTTAVRRGSLAPPKTVTSSSITKPTLTKTNKPLGSQSQLNKSPSSSNSVSSSRSDLTSNQAKPPKIMRVISHSIDLGSDKQSTSSRQSFDALEHQLMIQKVVTQSIEVTNENLKKQYQHLVNQFDIMIILNQYLILENDQIKQQFNLNLSKIRLANTRLKTSIEQIQSEHKNQLKSLDEQYQNQIETIKQTHKQESIEYQQKIEKLINEKVEIETRCKSLQEQVDRFMYEMENSEHADPLLRRVEILEKENSSLQTVVELRTQELTQLRTKINEQVFQREDQMALQKRIDMAENRNQDLVCLLRNWQLTEKAVAVERDDLKDQLAQLERDNRQLKFENETLLYRVRQQPLSLKSLTKNDSTPPSSPIIRYRANSFTSIIPDKTRQERFTRSLSLNLLINR